MHGLACSDSPALAIDGTARLHTQGLAGRHQAGDVIQRCHLQAGLAKTRQLSVAVGQLTDRGCQRPGAGHQAALAVEQLTGAQAQAASAKDPALVLIIQVCRSQLRIALGTQAAALVGEFTGVDAEVAAGYHGLAGVVDGLRSQAHIALGIAAVIGVDACFDDPVVGQSATGVQCDAVLGSQGLLAGQCALSFYRQISTGVDRPLGFQAGRFDSDSSACGGRAHHHIARRINLDITAGDHVARQFHTHTGLGADQLDRAHVHAAQRRGVNRQVRRLAAICRPRSGVEGACVDVVATGDDGEFFRLNLRVESSRAGDDFELVDVGRVQAGAFDGDVALVNLIAADLAVFDHCFTGGQRRVRRVDKAAAVAADAVRVGDDHMGRLPRHFGVAPQLAGAAAVDFVENDVGGGAAQVRVADDDAAQLGGLGAIGGVVENDPVGADVVVMELVVRQAAAVWRGDVDDGHAIARLPERGARRADHDAVGLGQQRLPEHRVGQDQR